MTAKQRVLHLTGVILISGSLSAGGFRFDPPRAYPHDGIGNSVALGDLNGDSVLDVVTPGPFVWTTWLGNGDGTLEPPQAFPFEDTSLCIEMADLNRDGRDDMLTGGHHYLFRVFLSRGDGPFEPPLEYPIESRCSDVAVADLDGDTHLDVLAGDGGRRILVYLGNGDGSLQTAQETFYGAAGVMMAPADYSGDGGTDLFLGSQQPHNGFAYMRGRGDGTFESGVEAARPIGALSKDYVIRSGDLDGDGYLDLVLGHDSGRQNGLGVVMATGRETWANEVVVPTTGGSVLSLRLADFDLDARLDLVYSNLDRADRVRLRPGIGDGTFGPDAASWPTTLVSEGRDKIAVGDLDRDGLVDIVFGDWSGIDGDPHRTVVVLNRSGNRPPVADAGPDQAVECTSSMGTTVTLDGSGSYDPNSTPDESDIAEHAWYEDRGLPAERLLGLGEVLEVSFGLGSHAVTLVVTDRQGATGEDGVAVVVQDTVSPLLAVAARPEELWPPDGRMVPVCLELAAEDVCDAAPAIRLLAVTSSEPDDGDIEGADLGTPDTVVWLRAERDKRGPGREYVLVYEAGDVAGNRLEEAVTVRVPLRKPRAPRSAASAGSSPSSAGCAEGG